VPHFEKLHLSLAAKKFLTPWLRPFSPSVMSSSSSNDSKQAINAEEDRRSPFTKCEGAPPIRDRVQFVMSAEQVASQGEIPAIVRELCLAMKNCLLEQDQFGAFFQFLMRRETFDALSLTPILKMFTKPKALSILSSLVPLVGEQFNVRTFLGHREAGSFASLVQAIHVGEKVPCEIHPCQLHCRYSLLLATLNHPCSFFASERAKRMPVQEQTALRRNCFLRLLGMYSVAVFENAAAKNKKCKKSDASRPTSTTTPERTVSSLKVLVQKDAHFLFSYLMNRDHSCFVSEIMQGLEEAFAEAGQKMPVSSPVESDYKTVLGSAPSVFQAIWLVHCKHRPLMYRNVAENRLFVETTISTCMSWPVFSLLLSHFTAMDERNEDILSNFGSIFPSVYLHIFSVLHGFVPALPKIIRYMSAANYQTEMTTWLLTHCANKETLICNGFAGLLLTPMALQQYIRMYEVCVTNTLPIVLRCPTSNEWRDAAPQAIRQWLADTHMSVARPEDMPAYTVFFDKVDSLLIDMNAWMCQVSVFPHQKKSRELISFLPNTRTCAVWVPFRSG